MGGYFFLVLVIFNLKQVYKLLALIAQTNNFRIDLFMDKLEFENFEVNEASDQNNGSEQLDDVRTSEEEAIKFSSSVMAALEHKAKEHNESNTSKVNSNQLKKVYRRGATNTTEEKGLHAMARVNMFLRMKKENKISYKTSRVEVKSELKELVFETKARIKVDTFVDITENWLPIDADFSQATEDIKTYELNYTFKDIDELYLDDYEKLDITWG